ncbi:MAG: lysoplasmalogenase [Anaerolineae bacterium]|nr:lysoplasmalogenase [Anaerolineae bacterium]
MLALIPIPFLVLTVALLVRAQLRDQRRPVYVWKPLSTLLVIAVAALAFCSPALRPGYAAGVLVALAFSLGGDVALMFRAPRAFTLGLALFLLAHVAYAVTFTLYNGFHPPDLVVAGVLLALAVAVYRWLAPGLGGMKGPVIVYIAVISTMVNRAISTMFGQAFTPTQAWLIALGALLFWASDLMLAVNRFRRPFRLHPLLLVLYYAGQTLIALSASCPALQTGVSWY